MHVGAGTVRNGGNTAPAGLPLLYRAPMGSMMTIGAGTGYAMEGQPVVLVAASNGGGDAERAVADLRCRILRRLDWTQLTDGLDERIGRVVIVAEAGGISPEALDQGLPCLDDLASARGLPIVISFAAPQLDQVAAALGGPHVTLLCEPTAIDWAIALAIATQIGVPVRLNDSWRESAAARLQRLNGEVARIADILARLAQSEEASGDVADRRSGYDPGPIAATQDPVTAQEVRRAIQLRRLRDKHFEMFGEGLFEDPAWDMLLDLYAAELEEQQVSVSSLCIAAAVAPTTALRWIAKMTQIGLFVRHPDPLDRRRAFMGLSRPAAEAMRSYMIAARRNEDLG